MPSTILASLLGSPSFRCTNDATGLSVWADLGIIDVEIHEPAAVTDQPLSNQQVTSSDPATQKIYQSVLPVDIQGAKIIEPSVLRVTALCSDLSTVKAIIAAWQDTTSTFSISTRSIITHYLCISEVEIEQTGEMISAVKITLTFEQAQPAEVTGYAPEQAADSSVYGVNIQTPLSVTPLATLTRAIASATVTLPVIVSGALIDKLGGPFTLDSSMLA
jgi:hypothetical protein